jgi:hypothetical protein
MIIWKSAVVMGARYSKMGSFCSLSTDEKGSFCSEPLSLNQFRKSNIFSILLCFRAPAPTDRNP